MQTVLAEGKIKIIGSGGEEHPGFHTVGFVVSNKAYGEGLHGLRDLGGHSVATTQFGGAFQYDIDRALKKCGIPEKTVRILGLQTNGNIASVIGGGQVDGAAQACVSSEHARLALPAEHDQDEDGRAFVDRRPVRVDRAVAPRIGIGGAHAA
jgi:hypothetical protein